MNDLVVSCATSIESMRCSSRVVPRVTDTSAWVWPRVNSAEPCVRGSTPTSQLIGRTVSRSRPSTRSPWVRTWLRDRKSTRLELQSHSDLVCRLLLEKKNTFNSSRPGLSGGTKMTHKKMTQSTRTNPHCIARQSSSTLTIDSLRTYTTSHP